MRNKSVVAATFAAGIVATPAVASDRLVKFEGGVGVHPIAAIAVAAGPPQVVTVTSNVVRGVNPGGRAWGILKLKATVKQDGSIRAEGEGLVLAATDAAGTRGGVTHVAATLFCGSNVGFSSPAAEIGVGGDFAIRGQLDAVPPNPCLSPTLLIRNATGGTLGAWFAAGVVDD